MSPATASAVQAYAAVGQAVAAVLALISSLYIASAASARERKASEASAERERQAQATAERRIAEAEARAKEEIALARDEEHDRPIRKILTLVNAVEAEIQRFQTLYPNSNGNAFYSLSENHRLRVIMESVLGTEREAILMPEISGTIANLVGALRPLNFERPMEVKQIRSAGTDALLALTTARTELQYKLRRL